MSTTQRISIDELNARAAAGEFDGPLGPIRVELVEGELREMSPLGDDHVWVVSNLCHWCFRILADKPVRILTPGRLDIPDNDSVLEPDMLWVRAGAQKTKRPSQAVDVLLLIEVADSSFRYDCGEKANLYAHAGIQEYWVIDIVRQQLVRFSEPGEQGYVQRQEFGGSEQISPLALPDVVLQIEELFLDETQEAT